jgi:hypothetical protein
MTRLSPLFAVLACSLLAASCAAEEGYTPIGEDREDKGGGLFYLSADNPSGTIYFDCDEISACDLELTVALAGSIPELATVDGQEALFATLISPAGLNDQSESMVVGTNDVLRADNAVEWTFTYPAIPPGDYSVTLDLSALDEASVIASSQLAESL